jgi:hypothetical protein
MTEHTEKNGNIKTIVTVVITIVLIMGWGISIGVGYQQIKDNAANLGKIDTRVDKLETLVRDGMTLRIQLQKDVQALQQTADKNSTKLDKIIDMVNDHLRQSGSKSMSINKTSSPNSPLE